MKPTTGTLSVTLQPDTISPPAPPYTYFGVAQSLMPGVKVLAAASPSPALALAFVAAHILECLLKAYLSKDGSDVVVKKLDNRHDLNKLWKMACEQGLRVPVPTPSWVDCLSDIHNRPYYLRYSTRIHGIITPGAEPMASELAELLESVRVQLK